MEALFHRAAPPLPPLPPLPPERQGARRGRVMRLNYGARPEKVRMAYFRVCRAIRRGLRCSLGRLAKRKEQSR
jgi:hypothetical protein